MEYIGVVSAETICLHELGRMDIIIMQIGE